MGNQNSSDKVLPEIGKRYPLTIVGREYNKVFNKQSYSLRNDDGIEFYGRASILYEVGDEIICEVESYNEDLNVYRVSIPVKVNKSKQMVRTIDRPILRRKNENPSPLEKTAKKFVKIFEEYHLHKCGKPEICRCCGKPFETNKGYRVEIKDLYFCADCKKMISSFIPKRGKCARFISTPMGGQPK